MGIKIKELIYSKLNALTFKISGGTKNLIAHKVNNDIQSLEGPEGLCLSLGLTIEIKNTRYKINHIQEKVVGKTLTYELSTAKKTKERKVKLEDLTQLAKYAATLVDKDNVVAVINRYAPKLKQVDEKDYPELKTALEEIINENS
jgi:hypothetical protein